MRTFQLLLAALTIVSSLVLAGCGGGGSSAQAAAPPPAAPAPAPGPGAGSGNSAGGTDVNVVTVTLDGGTNGQAFNMPFVDVTVCVPGTATCQRIDHVLVDTGSFGLRLAASALDASVALPKIAAPAGNTLAECASFASGIAWGSVRRADVRIGGETAAGLPVQVVNDASIAPAPSACTSLGSNFGVTGSAKGILGIGVFAQDCGPGCATGTSGMYYACDASACAASLAPLTSQVTNPVAYFAADNNGAVIALPSIPLTGTASASGTLTFGIGTRANNQLGTATVYATDANGAVQTTYNGTHYTSFFDTGSNALFFPDATLPQCSGGFYCPPTPQTLSAIVTSPVTGVSTTVSFTIVNPLSLSGSTTAAPVGGTPPKDHNGVPLRAFDWGLPFFFGRTVFVAMTGAVTPAGVGPYWAF